MNWGPFSYTDEAKNLRALACLDRDSFERTVKTLTKQTPLDKYISRKEVVKSSWYKYVCDYGFVPVISGTGLYSGWPIQEEYAQSMLLMHWPNWRKVNNILNGSTWLKKFNELLKVISVQI